MLGTTGNMVKSRIYKAKSLNTRLYVYGALIILEDNMAVIHTCETVPEMGEEDVGGVDHTFANVYVDIDTIEEQTSCA